MKIITFYSYKGGVGRTLALVNVANRLAEFGKKVCVMDFDLEAPGLDSKYAHGLQDQINQGLVDYIYSYSCLGVVPDNISDYIVDVIPSPIAKEISFIPAGNTESGSYWKKLSAINWWSLFYNKDSYGIDFFLNLKQQIEEKLHPDYLLIDSRTGITEMSSVTMSILADEIVVLAANNNENIKGCAKVLEALTKQENNLFGIDKKVHFVLTRIPIETTPDDITRNKVQIEQKVNVIKEAVNKNGKELASVNIIHSDRELEKDELCNAFYTYKVSKTNSATEYLNLYASLTSNDFTKDETENFNNFKNFQLAVDKATWLLQENKEGAYDNIINLIKQYPMFPQPYNILCKYYYRNFEYEKILDCAKVALEKTIANHEEFHYQIAYSCLFLGRLEEARQAIDQIQIQQNKLQYEICRINIYFALFHNQEDIQAISTLIEEHPSFALLYNNRANFYMYYKEYDKALKDVYKALELDTEFAAAYITLAEIKNCQGDIDEFYRNIELGLKYGFDMREINFQTIKIYKDYIQQERFINLMNKYNQEDFMSLIKI